MNFNSGVYTVLVTPFDDNNNIDFDSLDNLIDKQLNSNVTGLVILGTTSESPTINLEEKKSIVNFVYKRVSGKKKLIVGVGGNNTNNVINFSQFCENLCDGFMVTVPNYNKPTQNGIYQHFSEISNKFPNKPIILYNIPSRCCVNMLPETVKKIYDNHSNVLAIKEASGSMDQVMKIKSLCDIKIFSGDDALVLPIIAFFISRKDPSKVLGIMIIVAGILIIIGGAVVIGNSDAMEEASGRSVLSETIPLIVAGLVQIGLGLIKIKKS